MRMDDEFSDGNSTIGDDWVKGEEDDSFASHASNEAAGKQNGDNTKFCGARWARLLGVASRPNPLDDWDQLYNLNNQSGLRNDCRKLAKVLDNKKSVPELESFMTLYCKRRNVDYKKDYGWMQILEKMLKYDYASDQMFNIFFAFSTKYIPKETKDGAQIYDLFRLILQYHDPQISSHLDSLKCTPYSYTSEWFSTILASSIDDDACTALWSLYIEKGDPFLIFYMALVLVVNAREHLLQITYANRSEAAIFLKDLPKQLSQPDVNDFVQLAAYYADRTPQSIREDFHYLIFGANYDDEVGQMHVSKLLCLPVTVQELTRKLRTTITMPMISYFIIDCRTHEDFMAGQIYGSFNLDCKLLVDAPEQFKMAMSSLESYKNDQKFEEHICFIGYGDDEKDQYMNMVVAQFLRNEKTHVALAQGGYKVLHNVLVESNRLRLLNCHDEVKCAECSATKPKSWNLVGKMKEAVISRSSAVKEKVSGIVTSSPGGSDIKHISPGRTGKRYRNEPSVFSIDDDSDDDEGGAVFSSKNNHKTELLLSEQAEFIETFACHELCPENQMKPAQIALTRTHIHILHEVDGKPGYVTTEARHALSTVLRVTSKKKVPELLTFKFGFEISGEAKVTAVHKFLVSKAGECAKSVKTAIFALRPLSDPLEE